MSWLSGLFCRTRARRSTELSMADERLLRDLGIEPRDVHDAINRRRSSVWLAPMRRDDSDIGRPPSC